MLMYMLKLKKDESRLLSLVSISCNIFLTACVSCSTASLVIITGTTSSTSITSNPSVLATAQPAATTMLPTVTTSIPPPSTDVAPVPIVKVTVNSSSFAPDILIIPMGTVVIWESLGEEDCNMCHGTDQLVQAPHLFGHNIDIGITHMVTSDSVLLNGELPLQGIFAKYFPTAGTYTHHSSLNPELESKLVVY